MHENENIILFILTKRKGKRKEGGNKKEKLEKHKGEKSK